jgi:recombination protein RecR
MVYTSESIEQVVNCFASLPTIGRKTAQRLTYHLLKRDKSFAENFAQSILNLKNNICYCSVCNNYTELDPCPICASESRNNEIICVVEEPNDVVAIEKTNEFKGRYHVLHGLINPLDGVSPSDIKIQELIVRLNGVQEVILALSAGVEGEITTQYIAKLISPLGIKVTRLARGMPIGGELEFTDEATISRALEARQPI